MNLDLIKIKKIGNEFYGTFRWNDFDTGRFSYCVRRLTWSDMGFLV